MSGDFFDRLEAELGGLTRQGTHLDGAAGRNRRLVALIRHSVVIAVLAIVLAASLVSEFPASASGRAVVAQVSVVRGL
ncbi:MAG TPA: hypothetical protein VHV75_07885 [Solirubrobacteraceae bacterium]|nr:hypothetical protein [Solirubrobacteraceae bacterium]